MRSARIRRCVVPALWAAAFSAGAVYAHGRYTAVRDVFLEGLAARPGLTRVDLSRPGSVTVPIPQRPTGHHHGLSLYLDLGSGTAEEDAGRLRGLRGEVLVTDDEGGELSRLPLREWFEPRPAGTSAYLVGFSRWSETGGYTMAVTVEEGAPELAGAEATIYAQYQICELEALPGLMWRGLAWLAALPAAVCWLIVGVRLAGWPTFRAPAPAG